MTLGIIAEDESDCLALKVFVRRLCEARQKRVPGIRTKSGKGCCRISVKAAPTMRKWAREGVGAVVIVHDLDRNKQTNVLNDETALRARLEGIAKSGGIPFHVCIPIEEIEAWFWSDQDVLDRVSGSKGKGKSAHEPHLVERPKEALERLSRGENGKARYDPYQNEELAEIVNLGRCAQRCPAFAEFKAFLSRHA